MLIKSIPAILALLFFQSASAQVDCSYELYKQGQAESWCRQIGASMDKDCSDVASGGGYKYTDTTFEWLEVWPGNLVLHCYYVDCNGNKALNGVTAYYQWSVNTACVEDNLTTAGPPNENGPRNNNPRNRCGSVIEPSNQVVGETIPLVGLPFYLSHFSSRQTGRVEDYYSRVVLTNNTFSSRIASFEINLFDENENLVESKTLLPQANLEYRYNWDGNLNGINTWGSITRKIQIITNINSGAAVPEGIYTLRLGGLKSKKLGLGGWLPSIWKFYDKAREKVYSGDGSTRQAKAVAEGMLDRIASADGSEVYYFDTLGRIVQVKTGLTGAIVYTFNYRTDEKIDFITDAFGKKTRFIYDTSGNIKEIISAESIKTLLSLESAGNLFSVKSPKGEQYFMSYVDEGGLLKTFKKPNQNLTTFTYDQDGKLLKDSNSAGHLSILQKTDLGIDAISAMGRKTQYNFDIDTQTETQINPSGLAVKYISKQEENSVIHPQLSTKTLFQNDQRFGNQVKVPYRIETQSFGTSVESIEQNIELADSADPFSVLSFNRSFTNDFGTSKSVYDPITRTTTFTSAGGRVLATQIDSLERPVWEKRGTLVPTKYTYNQDLLTKIKQGEREFKYHYKPQSKLLASIENPANEITSFEYDEAQRLKSKTLPDGRQINFTYDSENNLVSITPPGRPEHKQIIGFNELLSSYNPPALEGLTNVNTNYFYNLDKQLTKIVRPNGAVINYNYSTSTGLLSSISGAFGTISTIYQNELPVKVYDNTGRSNELEYIGNTVSSSISRTATGSIFSIYKREPLSGAEGLIARESIEAGNSKRVINYEYDADKVITKKGDLNLFYNSPNGLLKETSIGNIREYYQYNKFGEVKSFKAVFKKDSKDDLLYSYKLDRDKVGRIVEKTETFGSMCEDEIANKETRKNCHDKKEYVSKYFYDKAGRLIKVKKNDGSDSNYVYDANSNRIGGNVGKEQISAVYDNQDRLIRYNNKVFTYNANGDLLTKSEREGNSYKTTDYIYDVFGQLRKAGNVSYGTSVYNRRISKLVNGVVQKYFTYTPEGQLIGEMDANMNLVKTFVFASKGHVPDYLIDQNGEKFKIISDQLGSIRLVVNIRTGVIIHWMLHDEFGRILINSNPITLPFGFAGGMYEVETGYVKFVFREYDPEKGRFTGKDPISFRGGDSNLYGYVLSDPINWIDPLGLIRKDPSESTGGYIGGGPNFIVSPNGSTVIVQPGAQIGPTNNGRGILIQNPGASHPIGNQIRIMDPVPNYPNGYIRVTDPYGRYLDPSGNIVPSRSPEGHWCK